MLSDEEKKAIEYLKRNNIVEIQYDDYGLESIHRIGIDEKQTILNLIEKQSKEIEELENQRQNGTLSDGYHTYNDLYYQRCVLFATICNLNKDISWKSKKHSDGKKCFDSDNWFIVGIDTPEGSYTYHYEMKYWDLFKIKELELGKVWDGHTEKDVTRLLSLIDNNISKCKIKAKIGKRMQKNNNTIHNAKLKHGIDYVYYDDVQEAKEENRICKEILQSLLEKE